MCLDDIVIFSGIVKNHVVHLRHLHTLLRNAVVKIKLKKCLLFAQKINHLDYKLNEMTGTF